MWSVQCMHVLFHVILHESWEYFILHILSFSLLGKSAQNKLQTCARQPKRAKSEKNSPTIKEYAMISNAKRIHYANQIKKIGIFSAATTHTFQLG